MRHKYLIRNIIFFNLTSLFMIFAFNVYANEKLHDNSFCNQVQKNIMGINIPVKNNVYKDWESFLISKASVEPLTSEQFTSLDKNKIPIMISCKMKSADLIQEVHGKNSVNSESMTCRSINEKTMSDIVAGLNEKEKKQLLQNEISYVFDEDISVFTGQSWTKPYQIVFKDKKNVTHIQSKRMQINWNNTLFKLMPERFRGVLYCHLIAPEHAKRIIMGLTLLQDNF